MHYHISSTNPIVLKQLSYWKRFKKGANVVIPILTFIGAGYWFGQYYKANSFELQKQELIKDKYALEDSVLMLHRQLRGDSVNRRNWEYAHYPATLSPAAVIEIHNATTSPPCYYGSPDNCWEQSIDARLNDSISIQLYCRNNGYMPLRGVRFACRFLYSEKEIIIQSAIMLGDSIVLKEGYAYIKTKEPAQLFYQENATQFSNTVSESPIKGTFKDGILYFDVGDFDINTEYAKGVILHFRLVK